MNKSLSTTKFLNLIDQILLFNFNLPGVFDEYYDIGESHSQSSALEIRNGSESNRNECLAEFISGEIHSHSSFLDETLGAFVFSRIRSRLRLQLCSEIEKSICESFGDPPNDQLLEEVTTDFVYLYLSAAVAGNKTGAQVSGIPLMIAGVYSHGYFPCRLDIKTLKIEVGQIGTMPL